MNELRAKAKELGINSFGMNKADLETAIADAEGAHEGDLTEKSVTEAPKYGKPNYSSNIEDMPEEPAAAPVASVAVDPAAVYAVLAKEINDKFAAMQQANPQIKASTPEAEINRRRESDRRAILKQEQVPITIHGGFIGAPKQIVSCVNGHVVKVDLGKTTSIPVAHAENIARSLQMQQVNLENMEKREQEALKALGV